MSTFLLGGEIEITRIGLGTNRIDDAPESSAILEAALDRGVSFIDTANIYSGGVSEKVIGQAIGSDSRAHIATKGGYHGAEPEKIAAAIDASRKNLGLETIDLYYLHRPHPTIPIEQSVDPIVAARQDGRVRLIGLSNVTLDQIDRVRRITPVAAVQNAYNCDDHDQDDVIEYCERHEIAFVPYFPLRGAARAQMIADRLGAPRTQVVLAAMLARSPVIVPIPGTRNVAHLESNLAAQSLTVTDNDLRELGFSAGG